MPISFAVVVGKIALRSRLTERRATERQDVRARAEAACGAEPQASTERVSTRATPSPWRRDGRALCVEKRRSRRAIRHGRNIERNDGATRTNTATREPDG